MKVKCPGCAWQRAISGWGQCVRENLSSRAEAGGRRPRAVPRLRFGGTSTCHPKRSERSRGSPRAAKAGTRPLPRNEIPTRGRPGAVGVRQRNGISTRGSRGRRIGAHGNGIPTRGTSWAPWVAVEERYLDSWQASNATSQNTVPSRPAKGLRRCHESEYRSFSLRRGVSRLPRVGISFLLIARGLVTLPRVVIPFLLVLPKAPAPATS